MNNDATPQPHSVGCRDLFGPLWYKMHRAMGLIGEAMNQLDALRETIESKDEVCGCSQGKESTATGVDSKAQEQGQRSQSQMTRVEFQGPHVEGQLVLSARNYELWRHWLSLEEPLSEDAPKGAASQGIDQNQLSGGLRELGSYSVDGVVVSPNVQDQIPRSQNIEDTMDNPERLSASSCSASFTGLDLVRLDALMSNEGVIRCIRELQKSRLLRFYPRLSTWLQDMECSNAEDSIRKETPLALGDGFQSLRCLWRESGRPDIEWPEWALLEVIASNRESIEGCPSWSMWKQMVKPNDPDQIPRTEDVADTTDSPERLSASSCSAPPDEWHIFSSDDEWEFALNQARVERNQSLIAQLNARSSLNWPGFCEAVKLRDCSNRKVFRVKVRSDDMEQASDTLLVGDHLGNVFAKLLNLFLSGVIGHGCIEVKLADVASNVKPNVQDQIREEKNNE